MRFRLVHRALLVLVLVGYGCWLGWAFSLTRAPFLGVEFLLDLVALGAAVAGRAFTRYPVMLLALSVSAGWLASVWFSVKIGYFAHIPWSACVLALLPGVLLLCLALYCCLVAWIFYGPVPKVSSAP